eukprot:365271-Chlamydomonas_euryale.AAC.10
MQRCASQCNLCFAPGGSLQVLATCMSCSLEANVLPTSCSTRLMWCWCCRSSGGFCDSYSSRLATWACPADVPTGAAAAGGGVAAAPGDYAAGAAPAGGLAGTAAAGCGAAGAAGAGGPAGAAAAGVAAAGAAANQRQKKACFQVGCEQEGLRKAE